MRAAAVFGGIGIAVSIVLMGCSSSTGTDSKGVTVSSTTVESLTNMSTTTTVVIRNCADAVADLVGGSTKDSRQRQELVGEAVLTGCSKAQFGEEFLKQIKTAPIGSVGEQVATSMESLKRMGAEMSVVEGKDSVLGMLCSSAYVSDPTERMKLIACEGFW